MTAHAWPAELIFRDLVLEPEDRTCTTCGRNTRICDHRVRRLYTLDGPLRVTHKLTHCPDTACPAARFTIAPPTESALALPFWIVGWDVFVWMGHRRFARHWRVPQLRAELADTFRIRLSDDAIEGYLRRYATMVAARHADPAELTRVYADVPELVLTIDGLQPEKGHETLYVVRELRAGRVWFAEPLLSSATSAIERLLGTARAWAARLGKPVAAWMSDKQKAFVTGIAALFPGVPHRDCQNHFVRELAKDVLADDRHVKVQMRRTVRGLRAIERAILTAPPAVVAPADGVSSPAAPTTPPTAPPDAAASTAGDAVVLDYCAAVRGILNDDQGDPCQPPGLRMAAALETVYASLGRCLAAKKGGPPSPGGASSQAASTAGSPSPRPPVRACRTTSWSSARSRCASIPRPTPWRCARPTSPRSRRSARPIRTRSASGWRA